jgi:hypothetical protein
MEINYYYMNKIQKPSHLILSKKELYFTACALFIMTATHIYTKDKFKYGYQFLLSFLSILPTIFIILKIQSLILLDIKRNPNQLNNSLKYVVYAMILIFGSAPFLYLWGMRDVISQLKW